VHGCDRTVLVMLVVADENVDAVKSLEQQQQHIMDGIEAIAPEPVVIAFAPGETSVMVMIRKRQSDMEDSPFRVAATHRRILDVSTGRIFLVELSG